MTLFNNGSFKKCLNTNNLLGQKCAFCSVKNTAAFITAAKYYSTRSMEILYPLIFHCAYVIKAKQVCL
jgi:hypothetical protein